MKLQTLSTVITAFATAALVDFSSVANPVNAATLAGLTDDNTLLVFDSANPGATNSIQVTGVDGYLLGIDFRPANGLIYGLSNTNNLYTIDPLSGSANFISTLSVPFNGGVSSGVDFNPAADRLRVVGTNGQNFRINVDNGVVAEDAQLNPGTPAITAAAYTNVDNDPATGTTLYNIDTALGQLLIQNPPNAGTQVAVGSLNISNLESSAGFDIITANGVNTAFAALTAHSITSLYSIDLATGSATKIGLIGDGKTELIGLTSAPAAAVPEPTTMAGLALAGAGLTAARRKRKQSAA
ncbi:MAG: DUF4394 domain-containing protein [Oscillatoriales cyanobacterium C42_A2020_001]|nr:DUF4394 domain-containing protein [Leptolyngbyaceae cyanobacterium C42_A2020_001]